MSFHMIFFEFFSFITYGPFSEPNDRLACFEISNASPGSVESRASKRKAKLLEIDNDRSHGDSNKRGLITDQQISMEVLQLQQLSYDQNTNDSNLIAFIAHEEAISRHIKSTEKRVLVRCNEYDPKNMYWKICDNLIQQ